MSNTAQASCFCMGKAPGCTCGGRCRCACTCGVIDKEDYEEFSDWIQSVRDKEDLEEKFTATQDWMVVVEDDEGQVKHRTRGGKGVVGQAIAKDKHKRRPPNCS